ncbi:MAG: translation initiation factor IF-3 [Halanaerobiales bacterium]|nr:translation initiation factor IF-3 [Halanaerobiales bacterium]
MSNNNSLRVNDQIRASKVRLIDNEGEQIGVKDFEDAITTAQDRGYDLVEVAPQADPPVCKIMDYGKYKYEQAKKLQKQKKNQNVMKVKEVQMGVKIQDHDFNVKLKQARRFLNDKNKVKVRIRFRGREMVHKDIGYELMDRLKEQTEDIGKVESGPKMEGHNMLMFLTPKSEN